MLRTMTLLAVIIGVFPSKGLGATTSMRVLYPSFAGTWAVAWVAKEASYFASEGLDVELIRVGGSSRMVAAMLGGSAPIIQAGASAAIAATGAGSDVATVSTPGVTGSKRCPAMSSLDPHDVTATSIAMAAAATSLSSPLPGKSRHFI